jgi:hypothetical protein
MYSSNTQLQYQKIHICIEDIKRVIFYMEYITFGLQARIAENIITITYKIFQNILFILRHSRDTLEQLSSIFSLMFSTFKYLLNYNICM